MRRLTALAIVVLAALAPSFARAASDPLCTGNYADVTARPAPTLRFGVDPGVAGSAGNVQLPSAPVNAEREHAALRALRPGRRQLVLRLNRMFFSDGEAGIRRFQRETRSLTQDGFEVELQVRYHPTAAQAGDLTAWRRYVRRVVDAFGPDPGVVAMTITNEVNVTFSPNTSDGAFPRAQDALIEGIEAAHAEALRRGFAHLHFGFTYAYRFDPGNDVAFFERLATRGGRAFRAALGFVGLDFYPGAIYPPLLPAGDTFRHEFVQAAGVLRRCLLARAHVDARVPIWVTETGVSSASAGEGGQAAALVALARAARDYGRTLGVTDFRWFNLRDSIARAGALTPPPLFAFEGLLRSDYTRKAAFAAYRSVIARFGARERARAARACEKCHRGACR